MSILTELIKRETGMSNNIKTRLSLQILEAVYDKEWIFDQDEVVPLYKKLILLSQNGHIATHLIEIINNATSDEEEFISIVFIGRNLIKTCKALTQTEMKEIELYTDALLQNMF